MPGNFLHTRRLAVLLVIVCAAAALAWRPPRADARQMAAGGRLYLAFRAIDRQHSPVRDLEPGDVEVTIGGGARPAAALHLVEAPDAHAPPPPLPYSSSTDPAARPDLYLVIDEDALTPAARERLLDGTLFQRLSPRDRVGLVRLHAATPAIPPTTDRDVLRRAFAAIPAGGERPCRAAPLAEVIARTFRRHTSDWPAAVAIVTAVLPPAAQERCGITEEETARLQEEGIDVVDVARNPEAALEQLARATAAFCVAAIDLPPEDRDGATHPLVVRVRRPDVRILARPMVTMPPGGRPVPALSAREMARSAWPHRDVPIRAAAYPSSNLDGQVKIVVLYEPADGTARLASASLTLLDSTGGVLRQSTAAPEDLAQRPSLAAFVAPPGRYRVRVAATSPQRLGGTVELDVDARLTRAGDLALSALAFGGPDVLTFTPRLHFTDEPSATAYLEIYGVRPGAALTARFELAATPDGPALATMPAMLPPSSTPGRIATAALPIGRLPAGDYVVRARVSVDATTLETAGMLRKQ